MATAFEYGLIVTLIGVVAVSTIQCVGPTSYKDTEKHITYDPPVLKPIGHFDPNGVGEVLEDTQTGCHYIDTREGITIRYTRRGVIDCPETVSVSLSQFDTVAHPKQ